MAYLIDRRLNSKNKSAVNRQRFIHRHRAQIRKAVEENLRQRSITNTESGESISIPQKDTTEPVFRHGQGGRFTHVLPGNREFSSGDHIARPPEGGGQGSNASPDGEGMDDFVFEISQQEFLDFLFEDMALPNLTKRQLAGLEEFRSRRAGFSREGSPTNIDVPRSMRAASARRIALTAGKQKQLREMEQQLAALNESAAGEEPPEDEFIRQRKEDLAKRIEEMRRRIDRVPFLDDFDIRYRRHEKVPVPQAKAVMFCLMDVSGSMDQNTKDLAKRFFILLYLFLSRSYDKIEVVFIRHHTSAAEVSEDEFFYSRETGGTVVSSALELTKTIIEARYPVNEWNIYCAQASDGDNWPEDGNRCLHFMHQLLPLMQYYAYIEITTQGDKPLWLLYDQLRQEYRDVFALQHIAGREDIYPVFHELFKKDAA